MNDREKIIKGFTYFIILLFFIIFLIIPTYESLERINKCEKLGFEHSRGTSWFNNEQEHCFNIVNGQIKKYYLD